MESLRVLVTGAHGRMGRAVQRVVAESPDLVLAGAVDQGDDPWAVTDVDVVVDFTTPEATIGYARFAAERGVPMVAGTTGLTPPQKGELTQLATRVPILLAPNMSVGVNVLLDVVARAVAALGPGWDAEVVELHHRHKVDAPSGTALRLAEAVAQARGASLAEVGRYERRGLVGERPAGEIGVQTLRGGDVVGEHTVYLLGDSERIELTHRATDRAIFAHGALRAARWVVGKPAALYSMADVLG